MCVVVGVGPDGRDEGQGPLTAGQEQQPPEAAGDTRLPHRESALLSVYMLETLNSLIVSQHYLYIEVLDTRLPHRESALSSVYIEAAEDPRLSHRESALSVYIKVLETLDSLIVSQHYYLSI